jgi:hypothetical protein
MKFRKVIFILFFVCGILNIEKPVDATSDLKLEVNLWDNSLSVLQKGNIIKKYKIASGREETPSPIGKFKIMNKSKDWGSGFGTRWLELNVPWGVYGIHGTNRPHLIGRKVSHGCIRMKNKDVEWLFNYIPIGTPVYIYGPLNDLDNNGVLAVGSRGTLVYLVQQRLKLAGFYSGQVNGIFNDELEKAIKNFQQNHNLTITGHGNQRLYLELGLLE